MQRTVAIAVWLGGTAGRGHLAGVLRYANRRDWNIQFLQNLTEMKAATFEEAVRNGTSGLITSLNPASDEAVRLIRGSKIPFVSIDHPEYVDNRPNSGIIYNDHYRIGKLAAEHLLQMGRFNAYGFVRNCLKLQWAANRERGFRETLRANGIRLQTLATENPSDPLSCLPSRDELNAWLRSLPKPAAVMTPNDFMSSDVHNACTSLGFAVPDSVAILGADNDEVLCENLRPPMSSIAVDFNAQGYAAAEMLDRLMERHRTRKVVVCPGCTIVARESTRPLSPAVALVNRALAYISENACNGCQAGDIGPRLGVSRRLLDLRFRQITGTSIRTEIERIRMENVRRLLANTRRPVGGIAASCGYPNANHLGKLFRKRFGLTMSDYRRNAQSTAGQGTGTH